MSTTTDLNPEMAAAVAKYNDMLQAEGGLAKTLDENRAQQARVMQFFAIGAPEPRGVFDLQVPTRRGAISARLHVPDLAPGPVVIFLHGGGWARGSIANAEWCCRSLAIEANIRVLALDYSLAPENPFPAALDEIRDVMDWCRNAGPAIGIDGTRIILAGASAGGNLSLTAALARRDAGEAMPIGLGLFYGVFGNDFETESYRAYGPGQYGLSLARMKQYFDWYVPEGTSSNEPHITPMRADLTGMPPSWIGFGEFDVLRDDSVLIERRLRGAGVTTQVKYMDDLSHGFVSYPGMVPRSREAISDLAAFIARLVQS